PAVLQTASVNVTAQAYLNEQYISQNFWNYMNPPFTGTHAGLFSFGLLGYIAGLTLSNDASSPNTVLDIASGVATDENGPATVLLFLPAFTKTTGAFVAGSGNGALDTGSIANNTWYH